jgi:hypothetical protein
LSIRGDQIDLVASELEAAGTSSRQLSIKAGGITEAKLGFSWDTVDILASAFSYDGTRSNFTLTTAASANANVLDNSELLRNGVGGMGRVVATASENDWSLTGTTLSVHGDITATGDGYTIRYVIGSASGAATASGNTLWMGTLPQTPLHVKSDYFGTGSLDPKWEVWDAITPGGTVTAVENSEGLVLTRAADTENFNGIIQTLPGDTTFALTAEIELDLVGGKLTGAGVLVAENLAASGGNPSTGKLWMNYVAWDTVFGNMIYQFATWADFNSFTAVNFDSRLGSDRSRIFLRLYVDTSGETIRALGSRDGHRWLSLGGSISYAGSTLGSIGFVMRNESGDDTIMYSSMFRVDATSDPYLPVGGYVGTSVPSTFFDRQDVTVVPNGTVNVYGWNDRKAKLIACQAFSVTAATVGAYTMAITKDPGGTVDNMLSAATFDMTSLTNGVPEDVALTGTADDLILDANTVWQATFTSDNAGLDAAGVYFMLTWLVL